MEKKQIRSTVGDRQMIGKFMVKEGEDQDWNLGKSEPYENAICKKLVMLVEHHYRVDIHLMDLKKAKNFKCIL